MNRDASLHQEILESIHTNAVDAIITIDEAGMIESVNPATEKMFGYPPEEILGRNISLLMPSPYSEEHDGYLKSYLDSGIRKIIGIGREVLGKRLDGSTFPAHLAVSEIRLHGKRMFTGVVRDITDLKEAQLRLAEINRQLENRYQKQSDELREAEAELLRREKLATLGQVAGGIAHEIRNPLNAVKTSAYYLSHAKQPSEEKVQEHLERIDRQVTLIDNVITALSDVARLPEANLQPVDIEALLRSIAKSVSLPSNIQIRFDFEENLPPCHVDANQIPIAFRNLIRNGRDAMKQGGVLTIGAKAADGKVNVFVKDTGVGIPQPNLDKVFEPLFTTKARGMGLGLAVTLAVVEKNKCELDVDSQVGEGSQFTVQIPAKSDS